MILRYGYGSITQCAELPEKNLLAELHANALPHERFGPEAVRYALEHPIGAPRLGTLVRPRQKIVIITSDISRPMPSYAVLPSLLEELRAAGVGPEQLTVVFGLGSHRHHTEAEMRHLVGDAVYEAVHCEDSTPEDTVRMGVTSRGTPVDISRRVAEADFRICLGNIEYHYFAGFSGGAKAIMPGVSTPEAIERNHRFMTDHRACAGVLEGNPIREDIEEAGEICGIDYILNVVLDEHKQIVYAVAGDKVAAHREGCEYLSRMYRAPIPRKADIVLVSQGGAPKDANLYQTQKALDNAKHAVRPGGTVILIGACNEGMGSAKFEQWFREAKKPEDLIDRVHRKFELGGHKAAAIAMVLQDAEIDLVSELEDDFVRGLFMVPRHSVQEALEMALEKYGPEATVISMPYGGSTLPVVE